MIFHTLCGAVVFVSGDPGQPNAPLRLVSQFQVSRWVGFLCEHSEEPGRKEVKTHPLLLITSKPSLLFLHAFQWKQFFCK